MWLISSSTASTEYFTLKRVAAPLLAQAQAQSAAADGAKVRLAGETAYQAGRWSAPRRVVFKAEVLTKGPNTRFVVTTHADPPLVVYDDYVDRGQAENCIKDLKNALGADRLSDHRFWANQCRLLLHAAAYVDRVQLVLASSHPSEPLWLALAAHRGSR